MKRKPLDEKEFLVKLHELFMHSKAKGVNSIWITFKSLNPRESTQDVSEVSSEPRCERLIRAKSGSTRLTLSITNTKMKSFLDNLRKLVHYHTKTKVQTEHRRTTNH